MRVHIPECVEVALPTFSVAAADGDPLSDTEDLVVPQKDEHKEHRGFVVRVAGDGESRPVAPVYAREEEVCCLWNAAAPPQQKPVSYPYSTFPEPVHDFCTSVREHCNSARVEEATESGAYRVVRGTVVVGAATDPGVAALMAVAAHYDASVRSTDGRGAEWLNRVACDPVQFDQWLRTMHLD